MSEKKSRVLYCKPSITELEVEYTTDAVTNGWGTECYSYLNRFEKIFGQHLGVNYSIATSSCTGALHMGLSALGIEPGDEVILADTNWIATASPIVSLGAVPIFVDILPGTWCIDPKRVEKAITRKTKAIIAVHLYGNLCEMDELLKIGKKYSIPIIEDAAEAIGSVYKDKKAGSMGRFGVFSFHGTKTLTTGEGGMFVTNDANLFDKVLTLSNHGRSKRESKQFWADVVGFKYKMSNVQAAIGYAQMQRIEKLIARKKEILNFYRKHLESKPDVLMNIERQGITNGCWMPTLVFSPETCVKRELLLNEFAKENIDTRVFFWPLSSFKMFEEKKNNSNAYDIPERAINLPSYHDISEEEQFRVINVIKKFL